MQMTSPEFKQNAHEALAHALADTPARVLARALADAGLQRALAFRKPAFVACLPGGGGV